MNYEIRDIGNHGNAYNIYYKGEMLGGYQVYTTAQIGLLKVLCQHESAEIIEEYILKLECNMFDRVMQTLDEYNRLDVKKRFIYI